MRIKLRHLNDKDYNNRSQTSVLECRSIDEYILSGYNYHHSSLSFLEIEKQSGDVLKLIVDKLQYHEFLWGNTDTLDTLIWECDEEAIEPLESQILHFNELTKTKDLTLILTVDSGLLSILNMEYLMMSGFLDSDKLENIRQGKNKNCLLFEKTLSDTSVYLPDNIGGKHCLFKASPYGFYIGDPCYIIEDEVWKRDFISQHCTLFLDTYSKIYAIKNNDKLSKHLSQGNLIFSAGGDGTFERKLIIRELNSGVFY